MDPDVYDYDAEAYKSAKPPMRPYADMTRGPLKKWVMYLFTGVSAFAAFGMVLLVIHHNSAIDSHKSVSSLDMTATNAPILSDTVQVRIPTSDPPIPTVSDYLTAMQAIAQPLLDHPVMQPRSVPVIAPQPVDILAFLDDNPNHYRMAVSDDTCQIDVGGQLTQIGMDELRSLVLVSYSPPPGKSTFGIACDGSTDYSNGDGEGIEVFFVDPLLLR